MPVLFVAGLGNISDHEAGCTSIPKLITSVALALDTYADWFPDDLEAVTDALEAAVAALMKTAAGGRLASLVMKKGPTGEFLVRALLPASGYSALCASYPFPRLG
ncbi:Uncharacterised protein [Mycobacteroides abscessus subsp. bolletii]|nr:Uncharacterised protein [Mycobacteroides abscessus subsp. bolletii]